jgi:hypothetical protein
MNKKMQRMKDAKEGEKRVWQSGRDENMGKTQQKKRDIEGGPYALPISFASVVGKKLSLFHMQSYDNNGGGGKRCNLLSGDGAYYHHQPKKKT